MQSIFHAPIGEIVYALFLHILLLNKKINNKEFCHICTYIPIIKIFVRVAKFIIRLRKRLVGWLVCHLFP